MKRKEKLEKMERERFGKNMAQMIGGTTASPSEITNGAETATKEKSDGSSTRWAALRGFIQQTMEQKPEFKVA